MRLPSHSLSRVLPGQMVRAACISLGLAVAGSPLTAVATPQYSLLSGNRCVNCHVSNQGSGMRNDLGRYSMDGVGLVDPETVGLDRLYGRLSSQDGPVFVGFDFRAQTVRSHLSSAAGRRFFPMQAALYLSSDASRQVRVDGAYNFGPKRFDGQQRWSASATFQPRFNWPELRVGYFQPSIGIRHDDHTTLVRSWATGSGYASLIAPNYAEAGAELTYFRYRWLTLTAGVFGARSLAENTLLDTSGESVSLIRDRDRPSVTGRAVLWPRVKDGRGTFYLGASYLHNDDFQMLNAFGGAGIQDRAAVLAEFARSEKRSIQVGRNVTVEVSVQPVSPLLAYVRGEHGRTKATRAGGVQSVVTTRQLVLGIRVMLLQGVELRPEYRLLDTETFRSTRYAAQLHLYY